MSTIKTHLFVTSIFVIIFISLGVVGLADVPGISNRAYRGLFDNNQSEQKSRQKKARRLVSYIPPAPNVVLGEVIVKYKPSSFNLMTTTGRLQADNFLLLTVTNVTPKERYNSGNFDLVTINAGTQSVSQKIAEFQSNPQVEYAQPNFRYRAAAITDANYGLQWGAHNTGQSVQGSYPPLSGTTDADIDLPEAFNLGISDDDDVIVALIDDGVAYKHPDLLGHMWNGSLCLDENGAALGGCSYGYNYQEKNKFPLPKTSSHGTHIAGIIGALKNAIGVVGVAPNSRIMALRMDGTTFQVLKSIGFAKKNGAKIINFSWDYYGTAFGSYYDRAMYDTIKAFPGIFVTSAGNGDANGVGYNHNDGFDDHHSFPAGFRGPTPIGPALTNLVVAAATDMEDKLTEFSDYGLTTVDMGAPGVNILSTFASSFASNQTFNTGSIPPGWVATGNWNVSSQALWADYSPYANNTNTSITSPSFNMSTVSGVVASLEVGCDTEYISPTGGGDYMVFEASPNGTTYTEIQRWNEYSLDQLNYDTDSSGTAAYGFYDLVIPANVLSSTTKFRLRWVTNSASSTNNGCYVDTLEIVKITDGSDGQYGYLNGTSQSAPYIAGAMALVWAEEEDLTKEQVMAVIAASGDDLPTLLNKTITGKRLNVFNALQLASDKALIYSGFTFNESTANDGTISNYLDIQIIGTITRRTVVVGDNVLVTNVPPGLTASFQNLSTTQLRLFLNGTAISHTNADDVRNLTVQFLNNTAFQGASTAHIDNTTISNITVDFIDNAGGGGGGPASTRRLGLPRIIEN